MVTFPSCGEDHRLRAFLSALGLGLGGIVLRLVSAVTAPMLYDAIVPLDTVVNRLLNRYVVQPGFGLVAGGYVLYRGEIDRFLRLRGPSPKGVIWISMGIVLEPVTRAFSEQVFDPTHSGGPAKWALLIEDPVLIPAAFVIMFVLMAPAEEALYRGVIHGRLRGQFDVTARIVTSALLFGLVHLVLSGVWPPSSRRACQESCSRWPTNELTT